MYISIITKDSFQFQHHLSFQLEKEMQTLRKVLQAKCAEASELKYKLGISPMNDLKEDVKHGFQVIQESEAYVSQNVFYFD